MSRLHLVLCFTLLVASVFCSPITNQKRSFKIARIHQANYVPNGPKALRKAVQKYSRFTTFGFDDISFKPNVALESKVSSSASTSQTDEQGEVSASPAQNDAEFLSPVSIGGQTVVMDFDTGSSDMWVFNTNLDSQSSTGHTIFDPSKSSTFQTINGAEFNISYGDGSSASGPVGMDTVDIGGASVSQQAIGLPNEVSGSFVGDTASNGLVGLAFSKLNTVTPQQQKTFFDNIQADLSQPLFTANLKHGTTGGYEFGTVDTTAFSGSLATVPVDSSQGFWQFASQSASVNGQSTQVSGGAAIADTGTSLMLADDAIVQLYYGQVAGAQLDQNQGGVVFPCDSQLPDLQIAVGDTYMATVSGELMNFSAAGQDGLCFGGLQSNQGLGFSIYGDVFFKSQFVVFDGSGPSLMVAPHA